MEEVQHCCICNVKAIYSVGSTNAHAVPLLYCEEHLPRWARTLYEADASHRGRQLVLVIEEEKRKKVRR